MFLQVILLTMQLPEITKGGLQEAEGLEEEAKVLRVYFGAPSMFITLWFGFDYGTNPPLGTLII
jgi:hypothetical protein